MYTYLYSMYICKEKNNTDSEPKDKAYLPINHHTANVA